MFSFIYPKTWGVMLESVKEGAKDITEIVGYQREKLIDCFFKEFIQVGLTQSQLEMPILDVWELLFESSYDYFQENIGDFND